GAGVAWARGPPARGGSRAAVPARELPAELLEPVDRRRGLAREHGNEPAIRGLVARLPDVLGVQVGRVVLAERGLDPSLRLRRVAGLQRPLRRKADPCAGALRRNCGRKARGPAADHEYV